MKALKVFCIIFTVVTIAVTGIVLLVNRFTHSEVEKVSSKHESTLATVHMVGDEYTYTIKGGGNKAMTETEYLNALKQTEEGTGYVMIGGGVLTVLFIAGAAASGKAAKRDMAPAMA